MDFSIQRSNVGLKPDEFWSGLSRNNATGGNMVESPPQLEEMTN
jgi:hypothetical protein